MKSFWGLVCLTHCCFIMCEGDVEYRKAQAADIPSILELMKEAASSYDDRVVIVPEACRESFVKGMIDKNILYVAVSDKKVVGTKKFFIAEGAEKRDILENLVRSEGKKADKSPLREKVGNEGKVIESLATPASNDWGVCLYTGFSYTLESFRRLNIQKKLTEFAYGDVAEKVKELLRTRGQKKVSLIVVLTYPNTGMRPNEGYKEGYDRTPSLAKGFQSFIKKYIETTLEGTPALERSRYNTFLPAFDPVSKTCDVPLPDEQSQPAYGYILTYELKGSLV